MKFFLLVFAIIIACAKAADPNPLLPLIFHPLAANTRSSVPFTPSSAPTPLTPLIFHSLQSTAPSIVTSTPPLTPPATSTPITSIIPSPFTVPSLVQSNTATNTNAATPTVSYPIPLPALIPLNDYRVQPDHFTQTQLYQNIFNSYLQSSFSGDFDRLINNVLNSMIYVLCTAKNDARKAIAAIDIKKGNSKNLDNYIEQIVTRIEATINAAELRFNYFVDNWITLLTNYRKIPWIVFSMFLTIVRANLPTTAYKMSGMIYRECGNITAAVITGEQQITNVISAIIGGIN